MSTDHAATVIDLLTGAGLSDVYRGQLRDGAHIPDTAAFAETTGGIEPESIFGGSSLDQPTVQVLVRGTKGRRDEAHAFARKVYDAVDHKEPTGYIDCRPQQSSPIFIRQDDQGRYLYSINVILRIKE